MIRSMRGFTLVELVATIVLLGILAVTALPRFASLGEEAEAATFEGVKANFKTGVALVHSTAIVKRAKSNSGGYPDIQLEGKCIQVDSNSGYPLVNQTSGTCNAVVNTLPVHQLDEAVSERMYALLTPRLDVQPQLFSQAIAGGALPPPPPPPPGTAELPALLMDADFSDWVWSKSPPTATLQSPQALSFTYNQNTGAVN